MANEPKTTADYLAAMVKHQRETLDATKSIDKTVRDFHRVLQILLLLIIIPAVIGIMLWLYRYATT